MSSSKQVAPGVPRMQREEVCPDALDLNSQPQYGNGCCCQCCGAGPAKSPWIRLKSRMTSHAGYKSDGRVIEYYVYGDVDSDRTLVQIHGSMSSAKMFSEIPHMDAALKEHKIRGIAVNLPGHGFTSPDPHRRMVAWPGTDLAPVLAAEKIPEDAPILVEGSSFGSAHASAC